MLKDCTFKPAVNNNIKVDSVYSSENQKQFSEQLKAQLKEKQAKIAQARRNKEYQEIKDCTFYPSINQGVPQTKEEVEIKGLERHLELKELQRRKDLELQLREAEVFGINCKFVGEPTKAEPFQLMTELRHELNE